MNNYSATDMVLIISAIGSMITSVIAAVNSARANSRSGENSTKLDSLKTVAAASAADVKATGLTAAAVIKADAQHSLEQQTGTIKDAIELAKMHTSDAAQQAYHEANTVNRKLEKLHAENERLARAFAELVVKMPVLAPEHLLADRRRTVKIESEDT